VSVLGNWENYWEFLECMIYYIFAYDLLNDAHLLLVHLIQINDLEKKIPSPKSHSLNFSQSYTWNKISKKMKRHGGIVGQEERLTT